MTKTRTTIFWLPQVRVESIHKRAIARLANTSSVDRCYRDGAESLDTKDHLQLYLQEQRRDDREARPLELQADRRQGGKEELAFPERASDNTVSSGPQVCADDVAERDKTSSESRAGSKSCSHCVV